MYICWNRIKNKKIWDPLVRFFKNGWIFEVSQQRNTLAGRIYILEKRIKTYLAKQLQQKILESQNVHNLFKPAIFFPLRKAVLFRLDSSNKFTKKVKENYGFLSSILTLFCIHGKMVSCYKSSMRKHAVISLSPFYTIQCFVNRKQ